VKRCQLSKPALMLIAALASFFVAGLGFAGATQFENRDENCATCHTQPEVEFVARAQAAKPADLASAHASAAYSSTRCIDCHAGPGPLGRAESVSSGAANILKHARMVVSNGAMQRSALAPHPSANCIQCHSDTQKTEDFDLHSHKYLPQWQLKDANAATCATCHSSHSTDGDPAIGYLRLQRTLVTCEQCHVALGVRK
jgi:predicted CxxxxCH...CXXCH cytochrome family protein